MAMADEFDPKLSVLPAEQRQLWDELGQLSGSFVLFGGTAVALHLGHRASVDFDFISMASFDPDELYASTPFLKESQTIQKAPNTLTCLVDRGGKVQVSFFGTPALRLIRPPLVARSNNVRVASLTDLAGMKAAVVQKRAEAKDYVDLDTMITRGAVDLPTALAAAKEIFGRSFNPELTLKALCFFDDGDLATLSSAIRARLAAAVRSVDLTQLPNVRPTHDSH
jgi:Nucleotidyl transferase AbiEii toxin, Type IV TA system